jgi:hypothetical protein
MLCVLDNYYNFMIMKTSAQVYNIYYDASSECIVMDWNGYATSEQFRQGTEEMLQLLIRYKVHKVLADSFDMVLISSADQDWIYNNFLPRAIDKGFKAIALVRPESYFNYVALESLNYRIGNDKISIRMFDKIDDAKHWLSLQ